MSSTITREPNASTLATAAPPEGHLQPQILALYPGFGLCLKVRHQPGRERRKVRHLKVWPHISIDPRRRPIAPVGD
ncbi:MAG: hypothetical protein KF705_10355 [Phycisphaeraceae bacterium]|nr:hypothetical protein [Phycisphaeraceae bacterium]